MNEGMFCAKFSKDGKYLAVSLLDYTVKIYFADSMKFFLSLFGHKVPHASQFAILMGYLLSYLCAAASDDHGCQLGFDTHCHGLS